jgi:hypothetical protein
MVENDRGTKVHGVVKRSRTWKMFLTEFLTFVGTFLLKVIVDLCKLGT